MKERINLIPLMNKKNIFGIDIDALTMEQTIAYIYQLKQQEQPIHILGVNADKINQYYKETEEFRKIINEAQVINADGASLVLASKILKKDLPERVAGIDLMQNLLSLCEKKEYTVFFLGAKESVIKLMIYKIETSHPNLKIIGYRNGYFEKKDWATIAEKLKEQSPDFVFIGITSPMKEYLIDYFMKQGINSVFMGVGGSFDVLSGCIKRAPEWMQKSNLEWLFRVKQEPHRLFRRYFIGNFQFLFKLIKEIRSSNNGTRILQKEENTENYKSNFKRFL